MYTGPSVGQPLNLPASTISDRPGNARKRPQLIYDNLLKYIYFPNPQFLPGGFRLTGHGHYWPMSFQRRSQLTIEPISQWIAHGAHIWYVPQHIVNF